MSERVMPVYHVLDQSGALVCPSTELPPDTDLLHMYHMMTRVNVMDQIFYDAQRQGRMSFYMVNYGEEAAQVGSAAALRPDDEVYMQYREAGVVAYRGFSLQNFADQLFSNTNDLGKGRQMPVHYGSKDLHMQTISSPLGTQLPQAVGAAYALKPTGRVVACYFGDGAASEGDFHAALNFAATLSAPVLFFCRNNGIAISTHVAEQYRGDGIAGRAEGYGIHAVRVDGNDPLAVFTATRAARRHAAEQQAPVVVEAMCYRRGHHSTSDDSTRYRSVDEMNTWRDLYNPMDRFRSFLVGRGLWDEEKETALRLAERKAVLQAIGVAESAPKPGVNECFTDVYDEVLPRLARQRQQLKEHIAKHGYPADKYDGGL